MLHRASKTFLVLLAFQAAACSDDGEIETDAAAGDGGSGGATGDCGGARVTIAFFSDSTCSAESQVGQRAYDTSLACFSWTAQGSHAEENSATRFQCYSDRLCYTQHADTLTCGDGMAPTDKQAKNAECVKEPAGSLYSRIVGGNEGCPPPPPGFECPESEAEMGTDGVAACIAP
jgi:hypothetical protein